MKSYLCFVAFGGKPQHCIRSNPVPSFNKYPIKANTSFKDQQHGIIESTLNRYKTLPQRDLDFIEDMTSDIVEKVLKICIKLS